MVPASPSLHSSSPATPESASFYSEDVYASLLGGSYDQSDYAPLYLQINSPMVMSGVKQEEQNHNHYDYVNLNYSDEQSSTFIHHDNSFIINSPPQNSPRYSMSTSSSYSTSSSSSAATGGGCGVLSSLDDLDAMSGQTNAMDFLELNTQWQSELYNQEYRELAHLTESDLTILDCGPASPPSPSSFFNYGSMQSPSAAMTAGDQSPRAESAEVKIEMYGVASASIGNNNNNNNNNNVFYEHQMHRTEFDFLKYSSEEDAKDFFGNNWGESEELGTMVVN